MRSFALAVWILAALLVLPQPVRSRQSAGSVRPTGALSPGAATPESAPDEEAGRTDGWSGFDAERFRLHRGEDGWRLEDRDGASVPVPTEWLEPPEAVESAKHSYVTSLRWDEQVTAFPIGAGRLALHLSSYAIQEQGSARAAAGRDLLLILEPSANQEGEATGGPAVESPPSELHRGLDLGESKGRVRFAGCFSAHFHRLAVGDVDCDRLLDVAVMEERIDCEAGETDGLYRPVYRVGPLRWHIQRGDAWSAKPALDGRLPCRGLQALPLVDLAFGPVEMVLRGYSLRRP